MVAPIVVYIFNRAGIIGGFSIISSLTWYIFLKNLYYFFNSYGIVKKGVSKYGNFTDLWTQLDKMIFIGQRISATASPTPQYVQSSHDVHI